MQITSSATKLIQKTHSDHLNKTGPLTKHKISTRRDDVSSRTDILISVREIVIGSKIGLTLLFVFLKTYVLMRILITNDLQKTATLYRLCRRRLANRRDFFHTFEMSYNPKDHRAVYRNMRDNPTSLGANPLVSHHK